jgi:hypothetical protein
MTERRTLGIVAVLAVVLSIPLPFVGIPSSNLAVFVGTSALWGVLLAIAYIAGMLWLADR